MGLALNDSFGVPIHLSICQVCISAAEDESLLNQIHLPLFFPYSWKDKCRPLLRHEICKNSLVSVVGGVRLTERSELNYPSSRVMAWGSVINWTV